MRGCLLRARVHVRVYLCVIEVRIPLLPQVKRNTRLADDEWSDDDSEEPEAKRAKKGQSASVAKRWFRGS